MIELLLLIGIVVLSLWIILMLKDNFAMLKGNFMEPFQVSSLAVYNRETYPRSTYAITQQPQGRYTPSKVSVNEQPVSGTSGQVLIRAAPGKWLNLSRIRVLDANRADITTRMRAASKDVYNWCHDDWKFGRHWNFSPPRWEPNNGCERVSTPNLVNDGGTGMRNFPDIYHSDSNNGTSWIAFYFDNLNTYISQIEIWNRGSEGKENLNGAQLLILRNDGSVHNQWRLTSQDYQTFVPSPTTCPAGSYKEGGAAYGSQCIRNCAAGETLLNGICYQPCPAGFNLEGGTGGQCVRPCNGTDRRDGSTCFTACRQEEITEPTICRRPCRPEFTLMDERCYPTDFTRYLSVLTRGNLRSKYQNLNVTISDRATVGNGTPLAARANPTSQNNDTSEFTWIYTQDGTFVNALTRKCLDVPWGNTANGSVLQHWDCLGNNNQRWFIDAAGVVRLWNNPSKCLDVGNMKDTTIYDAGTSVENPMGTPSQRTFVFPDFPLVGASPPTGALPAPIAIGIIVIGTDNSIYYAEEPSAGAPPGATSWIKVNGSLRTASLSDGHIYGVNSVNQIYVTNPNTNIRDASFNMVPQPSGMTITMASRSGRNVVGVTSTNEVYIATQNIQFEPNWRSLTPTVCCAGRGRYISLSGTRAILIGLDYRIYYIADITSCTSASCGWIGIQGALGGRRIMCVDIDDNRVMAIDTRGSIFVADTGIDTGNPNWYQLRSGVALHGSMKNGRIYVRGTDNFLYYTNDYRSPNWIGVPLPSGVQILHVAAGTRAPAIPAYCTNNPRRPSLLNGTPAYIYTKEECDTIGRSVSGGSRYSYGTGECILNDAAKTSVSRQCSNLSQEPRPQDFTPVWGVPQSMQEQKCWFDPIAYGKKYNLNLNDIGAIRNHFVNTGIDAGFSPCGDENPSCRWDADDYLKFNPDVAKLKVVPKDHYKTTGFEEGRYFCNKAGFIPLLDSLKRTVQRTIVAMPSDLQTACKATSYTGGLGNKVNQYICSDREKAEKVIAGPGSGDTAYVGEYDTVCYTNDASSKTYYCKSVQEDRNGYDYTTTMIDDYDTMCDTLVRNFTDLSNNVTNLINMNGGLADARTNINNARTALQNIATTLKCDTTAQKDTPACRSITGGISSIESNYSKLDGSFQALDPAVTRALDSRTMIRDVITNFQCKL